MYAAAFVADYANKACGMSTETVREVNSFGVPLTRAGSVSSITSGDSGLYSRRKMSTVRSLNKEAILAIGEDLRQSLREHFPGMIKDRRYHLKIYSTCLVGNELVTWLVDRKEVETRKEAVAVMQKLLENGVIHHGKRCHFIRVCVFRKVYCSMNVFVIVNIYTPKFM